MTAPLGVHKEQIKATIRIKYGSLSAFEIAKGLPSGSARDVLRGRSVRRTAEALAAEMELPLHAVFPGLESTFADCADGTAAAQCIIAEAV